MTRVRKMLPLWLTAALVLSACGSTDSFLPLTAENPVAQTAEGFIISANPAALSAEFGVQVQTIALDALANPDASYVWKAALQSLPAHLSLLGPVFEIKTNGAFPGQAYVSVPLPATADPNATDVYAWDGAQWVFLPAQARGGQLVAAVRAMPQAVTLLAVAPTPPLALIGIEPGQTLAPALTGAANAVLLGGVTLQADGALAGQLPGVPTQAGYALFPVVRNQTEAGYSAALLTAILSVPEARAKHLQQLAGFAAAPEYAGLVLDYRGLTPDVGAAFASLVSDLSVLLHAQNKTLMVQVETPTLTTNGDYFTGAYDWAALNASADALIMPLPAAPPDDGNGAAEALVRWAVGQVSRSRLRLFTSALSVEENQGVLSLVSYDSALAHFGAATAAAGDAPQAGQAITLTLSGQAQSFDYDANAFAPRFVYADSAGGTRTVWLTTADTLRQRLALAEKYRLGGVVVMDLSATGLPAHLPEAVTQYKAKVAAQAAAPALGLTWQVNADGALVAQATAQPGQPFVYVAQTPGQYEFSAQLQAGSTVNLGAVAVAVAAVPTPTPTPSVSINVPSGGSSGGGSSDGGTSGGGSSGGGGFVPPPPIAGGAFELGGQVPGYISHAAPMQQAGMKWVKFQATGDAAGMIAGGHAAGFKVLLSALGDHSRAADPGYWPEYASWVAGMAAAGADAIEIWNEMNIEREWPFGKISGATYTEMLKQAYTAIKATNPNTLVISGALAPTGAEGAFPGAVVNDDNYLNQMAAAGAASYMDCVGIHFNTGTTSPYATSGSALSGYHYSYYYGPMVDTYYNAFGGSRQLCFTELGYLSPEGFNSALPANFSWAADTSVAEQAQWLAESASLAGSSGKVRMMIIFNVDFTLWGADPQGGYAIVRPDGNCPACAALDAVMP